MPAPQIAELFFKEAQKIVLSETNFNDKVIHLTNTLYSLFNIFLKDEKIPIADPNARIAYVCDQYQISKALRWRIYKLRQREKKAKQAHILLTESEYFTSLRTTVFAIAAFCQIPLPSEIRGLLQEDNEDLEADKQEFKIRTTVDCLRVYVFGHDFRQMENDKQYRVLNAYLADEPTQQIKILCDVPNRNYIFSKTVDHIIEKFNSTAILNLVEVIVDTEDYYIPKMLVLEPDFLLDVTAVAECFQGEDSYPNYYLLKKFIPVPNNVPLMIGNISNFFLDELMSDPKANFQTVFKKCFSINPINFALQDDQTMRDIYEQSKIHFASLQRLVNEELKAAQFDIEQSYLEPSFYSNKYGVQGRLDVWNYNPKTRKMGIIELKSGSPRNTNKSGIMSNHYMQTILYGLLIKSVYNIDKDFSKYIFYSRLEQNNLKIAPSNPVQEQEAIRVRNELIVLEKELAHLDAQPLDESGLLDWFSAGVGKLPSYVQRDFGDFAQLMEEISKEENDVERRYFLSFVSFIAREHQLARIGVENNNQLNGAAALWLYDTQDKLSNYELLQQLKIIDNQTQEQKQVLTFSRLDLSEEGQLANFREGDIVILYPKKTDSDTVLTNQIFKGSIQKINPQELVLRLNFQQFNQELFSEDISWCIEQDMMDKGYMVQYQSLYGFFSQPKAKRKLLLTINPPTKTEISIPERVIIESNFKRLAPKLTQEQLNILTEIIISKDYYLLVGPPGTGKTKYMLANVVRYLLNFTDENILLLAYTNRAVDEICEAIYPFAHKTYLRIGSRSSVKDGIGADGRDYNSQYLQTRIENIQNRKELRGVIDAHRVIVSTVASVVNNPNVLKLKKFHTAVIDEASQVLEPMLIGMLASFPRFVLIGDNKQLPAVVLQKKEQSAIKDDKLAQIGLTDRRNSLFERLIKQVTKHKWDWATNMLQYQGRMHEQICSFPSQEFYQGRLEILPEGVDYRLVQKAGLQYELPRKSKGLDKLLASKRCLFFPTATDFGHNNKVNKHEAEVVAEIVEAFIRIYALNNRTNTPDSIGIITPYRAQIAKIRQELLKKSIDPANITIDTVERYQGGARDIIILSVCVNNPFQLKNLVSLDETEQVDRKLNVALTRAREHLIVVGNESLLNTDPRYRKLIDWLKTS